jgi:LysR family glycine cleavage system transcriptional activator
MGVAMGQQPYLEDDLVKGSLVELFPERRIANPKMWYLACRKGDEAHERIACFSSWLKTQIDADAALMSPKMAT